MSSGCYLDKTEVLKIVNKVNSINNSYCNLFDYLFNQKLCQQIDYRLCEKELDALYIEVSNQHIKCSSSTSKEFNELIKLLTKYQEILMSRIKLLLEMVSKLHKKAEGGKYSIFKYSSNLRALKRLEKTSSEMGKEFDKYSYLWKGEDVSDRIGAAQAVILFVDEVLKDSLEDWAKIRALLESYNFVINEGISKDIFFIGMLAIDTMYSYEILDPKTAKSINTDVQYYIEFETEVTKEYPKLAKEAFSLFTYLYLNKLCEYMDDSKDENMDDSENEYSSLFEEPSFSTSMFLLLGIIYGLDSDPDSLPPKEMCLEFYEIILKKLGRWDNLTSNYSIQWLD